MASIRKCNTKYLIIVGLLRLGENLLECRLIANRLVGRLEQNRDALVVESIPEAVGREHERVATAEHRCLQRGT